jgi:hypothetical protein
MGSDDPAARVTDFHLESEDGRPHRLRRLEPVGGVYAWAVELAEPLKERTNGDARFAISYRTHNCYRFSVWEAMQWARERRQEPDEMEWTYISARFPCRKLTMTLELPTAYANETPVTSCRYLTGYPKLTLMEDGGVSFAAPGDSWVLDPEMTRYEQPNLRRTGAHRWTLEIEHPLVGYQYGIGWRLPNPAAAVSVSSETEMYQRLLIGYCAQRLEHPGGPEARAIGELGRALLVALDKKLGSPHAAGGFSVALMAFDPDERRLRIVDGWQTGGHEPDWDLRVPIGRGISGSAFKQRRPLFDHVLPPHRPEGTFLPNPDRIADLEDGGPFLVTKHRTPYRAILALPVYHPSVSNERQPAPDSVVGVVVAGATTAGSQLAGLADLDDEALGELSQEYHSAIQLFAKAVIQRVGSLGASRANG